MKRSSLVLVPQHFGALLFDRCASRYLPFDAGAASVLAALCDDSADDVMAAAAPEQREVIEGLLGFLLDRGFLRLDGRLAAERIEREPPPDHLLGPLAVHLEVSATCNLACAHCFAGEPPHPPSLLSVDEMDQLFAELASIGSFRLGLTGGEPLLRRELLEVIDAAVARGLHPCLTTNGLLLDERWARELGHRDLVWLNVSLEGADAPTNDAVRGLGVFDAVISKLKVLRRHARFTLAFTLTRKNAGQVEACASLARRLGAETAVFRPLYPVGNAANAPGLMPTFDEYVGALARLGRIDEHGAQCDLESIDPFCPAAREELRGVITHGPNCGAATKVASVSADGTVSPCSFLGTGFEAGNIRERSFEEIWSDGLSFRRLRAHEATDRFRGGCRARALSLSGSAYAEDPWQAAHERQRAAGHGSPLVATLMSTEASSTNATEV